jgi:hypothetical protein
MGSVRGALAPAVGRRVGPYRLVARLGGGHETEVWRADGDGIVVALKLARDAADPNVRARLAREAAALQRVRHDAVVRLLDAGEVDAVPFLALDPHDAGTLAARLDDGRLSLAEAAAVLAPIAHALAVAHAAGVVHRDVKPGNVLLAADGPLLVDFGASAIDGSTLDGWVDGAAAVQVTTAYAAPELEMARVVDGAADVWSVGAVLAECVAGTTELARARDALPAALRSCLDLDPAARPSMGFIAATLDELAGDAATRVAPMARPVVPEIAEQSAETGTTAAGGRELELARLADLRDAARASDELRAVLVVAPPGQGKTWLLDAAAAAVVDTGGAVLRATCSEQVGDLRVLGPWVRRFGASLGEAVGAAHASELAALTGETGGVRTDVDGDSIAAALAALVGALDAPLAIVDDLHHARPELLDVLGRLAFRPRAAGLLLLGARPATVDSDELGVETLPLGPLADDVIAAITEDDGAVAVLAGGNPLLAQELARARARGGELTGDVETLITRRLDALDPRLRDALAAAAACGEVFWPEAIGAPLRDGTAELARAGLVSVHVGSAIAGSTEAGWSHPLLREVAYARLDDGARRDAHGHLAVALDTTTAPAETVAFHAGRAFRLGATELRDLTADRAATAAREAIDRFALSTADDLLELIRETGIERSRGTADLIEADLCIRRGDFERALKLAEEVGGVEGDMRVTEAAYGLADVQRAVEAGERTERQRSPTTLPVRFVIAYASALANSGQRARAAELLDRRAVVAAPADATRLWARAAIVATQATVLDGAPIKSALERTKEILATLARDRDRRLLAEIALDVAKITTVFDPYEALELLDAARTAASEMGDDLRVAQCDVQIASTAFDLGRPAECQSAVERALNAREHSIRIDAQRLGLALDFACGPGRPWEQLDALLSDPHLAADHASVSIRGLAVAAPLWFGDVERARGQLPLVEATTLREMFELTLEGLQGPPWVQRGKAPAATAAHNERALLHLLAGRDDAAAALLRERHRYLVSAGTAYQRFNAYFPGALVSALGPDDTEPRREWLLDQIFRPPMPMLWLVHRAIAALILAERGHPARRDLVQAASEMVDKACPNEVVLAWLVPRLRAAAN